MRLRTAFSKIIHDLILLNRKLFRLALFARQFFSGWRINRNPSKDINRILLIRLQRLGDLMMTKPVIDSIRRKYPNANIDIITATSAKLLQPLFIDNIDDWYCYDSSLYQADASDSAQKSSLAKALGEYDLIVEFDGDLFTLGLVRAIRPCRYLSRGFTRFNEILQGKKRQESQLELLSMIAEIDIHDFTRSKLGTEKRQKVIEIHPFSGARIRDLEPQFWGELILELKSALPDFQIKLTGYGNEKSAVAALARETQSTVYVNDRDVLHRTFRQTVALVICPDTFTMHFAAGLGTPVIALFGPQAPERYSSFYPTVHSIYHRVSCSPCGYNNFGIDFCPYNKRCTQLITVGEVVRKAKELLHDLH